MTRSTLAFTLAVAIAAAVPTLGLVSPSLAQTVSAEDTRDVTGTTWTGPAAWVGGETRTWTLSFRADGVLAYSYNGNAYDNGRWLQRDRLVIFHTNDYFAVYTGTLEPNAREFSGAMFNVRGDEGAFRFRLAQ